MTIALHVLPGAYRDPMALVRTTAAQRVAESTDTQTFALVADPPPDTVFMRATGVDLGVFGEKLPSGELMMVDAALTRPLLESAFEDAAAKLVAFGQGTVTSAEVATALASGEWAAEADPLRASVLQAAGFARRLRTAVVDAAAAGGAVVWEYTGGRAASRRELLGEITCPSGQLVLVDGGYLRLWSGSRSPATVDPELLGVRDPEDVRGAADLEIVGPDAEAAARSFDRQEGVWLYDIPASGIAKVTASFDEHCAEHRLTARLRRVERVPHRTRVRRCAPGGFLMFGVPVVAIAGVPTDRALPVYAVQDGDQWQAVVHVSDVEVVSRHRVGAIFVDWARYAIADADALDHWRHDDPIDGRADVVFWGRDAEQAAADTNAPRLSSDDHGWSNVDIAEAASHMQELIAWQDAHPDRKIVPDFRPHSHHWAVMREVRAAETDSGTVAVGGAHVLFAMTPHGDGSYPVYAEYGRSGDLAAIRLVLG